jgi:hypothetical protein
MSGLPILLWVEVKKGMDCIMIIYRPRTKSVTKNSWLIRGSRGRVFKRDEGEMRRPFGAMSPILIGGMELF